MKMPSIIKKIIVAIAVVLICVGMIQLARFFLFSNRDLLNLSAGRMKGSPGAEISIVEYTDYRCSFCAVASTWLDKKIEENPDAIHLETRHFPIYLKDGAFPARFAECALRQQKFHDIHEELMNRQAEWIKLANPEAFFITVAEKHGLNIDQLTSCWADPDLYDAIIDMKHQGKELGVTATPTFFINGKKAVGINQLQAEVNALLNPAENDQKP